MPMLSLILELKLVGINWKIHFMLGSKLNELDNFGLASLEDFGPEFGKLSKFFLDERLSSVCSSPPYIESGDPVYFSRLIQEVKEVNRGNFWGPLTFASQVVALAREAPKIPYLCRGSAGSSLLCYLAGVSDVDPVASNLSLARFMGGGRDKPPDIDLDFPAELRSVLWQRIRAKYGDSIGFVATKLCYRQKGALREALRRCGIGYEVWVSSAPVISSKQRQEVMALASSLEGKEYGIARHCGGIVYFQDHLEVPSVYCSARQKQPFTQLILDKEQLEGAGLAKLDILSNRALSHLRAMGYEDRLGKDPNDELVGKMFSQGETWGIVQGESPAMRKIFSTLRLSDLAGVTLALGLVRPATGGGLGKPSAVGRNPIERRLVYEDDVTEFLSAVMASNTSLAEYSRRVLAKGGQEAKKLVEDMERIVNRKGRDKVKFRGQLWTWTQIKRQLGLASSYAFCKAHATAYGRIVWTLGLAKTYDPELFWRTFMNTALMSSMYLPWVYMERIKRSLNVRVVWPGDMGIKLGSFFNYPWVVYRGKFMPNLGGKLSVCDSSRGFGGWGNVMFQESLFGIDSADDGELWKRQLVTSGFWAGNAGPIKGTYFDIEGHGEYRFNGLRALRYPRFHPLDRKRYCLFETLGFGSLKVLEYTKVESKLGGITMSSEKERRSPFLGYSGQGKHRRDDNSYYFTAS